MRPARLIYIAHPDRIFGSFFFLGAFRTFSVEPKRLVTAVRSVRMVVFSDDGDVISLRYHWIGSSCQEILVKYTRLCMLLEGGQPLTHRFWNWIRHIEAETESDIETEAETETESKSEPKLKVKPRTNPIPKLELKPNRKNKTETKSKQKRKTKTDTEAETETEQEEAESETETKVKLKPKLNPNRR